MNVGELSGSEYEDAGSGDDDDYDDETESEPERLRTKREPAVVATYETESDDNASDESDESDDSETEDEMPPSRHSQPRQELTSADLERAARYEAEESAVVVKEERGVRGLFGDDDDGDDDDDDFMYAEGVATDGKETLGHEEFDDEEDEETEEEERDEAVDVKPHVESVAESLVSTGGELLLPRGDGAPEEINGVSARAYETEVPHGSKADRYETKTALWSLVAHVSRREQAVLRQGQRLDGPPIEDPIVHRDEFKRKFRWPVRLMNLREQAFTQDPMEIYNDYELELARTEQPEPPITPPPTSASTQQQAAKRVSAFAQVPRPIVEAAAAAAAESQRSARKRKRPCDAVSAAALTAAARVSEQFADRLLESLVRDNAAALQGRNPGYAQRSWTPLPVSRRPVANWRFVLENALKHSVGDADGGRLSPSLRPETLDRIRERLQTLYSLPWKTSDNDLFPSPSEAERASTDSPTKLLIL